MSLTIVDYDAGNLRSVERACRASSVEAQVSADPEAIRTAERIIFPGVGHAQAAMEILVARGLDEALREAFKQGTPILGICVGAQLILERSEESEVPCLGLIEGEALRFVSTQAQEKIPHIGWNEVQIQRPHPLLAGIEAGDELYFVHSYYPRPKASGHVFATSEYAGTFCCALGRDNLFATQFHPEKSGPLGLDILKRFSTWNGGSTC